MVLGVFRFGISRVRTMLINLLQVARNRPEGIDECGALGLLCSGEVLLFSVLICGYGV